MTTTDRNRKSTIYDIAKATGSSTAAVSMVLNGTWTRYRIKEATANRIVEAARELGYSVNLRARGLRLSRSGLAGMILPHYRNPFFAGLAEKFEAEARHRGLCPIVVSTQRDPTVERSVTQQLLSQHVELLFIAGVQHPTPLNALCATAGVTSINVDLPGDGAPSVVSDNRGGAKRLTAILLEKMATRGTPLDELIFVGGVANEYATEMRIAGYREALQAQHGVPSPHALNICGYSPAAAQQALAKQYQRLGRLPAGLLINSITAFEGLVDFASTLGADALKHTVVGCFDWDPFAARLPFDVTMLQQDVRTLIDEAFLLVDTAALGSSPCVLVPTLFQST